MTDENPQHPRGECRVTVTVLKVKKQEFTDYVRGRYNHLADYEVDVMTAKDTHGNIIWGKIGKITKNHPVNVGDTLVVLGEFSRGKGDLIIGKNMRESRLYGEEQ